MYDEYPGGSGIFDTMLFGYARVSTAEQNSDHQIDALVRAGVAAKHVYVDRASGAKASRPRCCTESSPGATRIGSRARSTTRNERSPRT